MEPLVIGVLVFATMFIGALAILSRSPQREVVAVRLREIEEQRSPRAVTLSLPFHRRAFLPLIKSTIQLVTRIVPPKSLAAVRGNLEMAGRRYGDPLLWILVKWLSTGAAAAAVYGAGILLHLPRSVWVPLALAFAILGYLWPEVNIRRTIQRRQTIIIKELPETLDLLTIAVEAGLGLDQALAVVATRRTGPLSEEIRAYLDEVGFGRERLEALRAIGRRTGVEELISFTATLGQAMEFGVSIADVLRIQADEVRTRRRQRIEERALKAPVKLLFPMIFLIMPALFVVAAGPGLIRVYTEFIKPVGPRTFSPPPASPGR